MKLVAGMQRAYTAVPLVGNAGRVATRRIAQFHSISVQRAAETAAATAAATATTSPAVSVVSKLSKDQLKKRELRRFAQRKAEARRPASEHPLYMPVTKALRFLRAAEVGQPESQQTISLTTLVVSEKGAPKLTGSISFPKPLKDVKLAVFSSVESQLQVAKDEFQCHLVGGAELIEGIKNGTVPVDFDKAFATPEIVPTLTSQLARTLGPRGVLPSLKKGTVSEDIASLIKNNMGLLPFRELNNCISVAVGRCSFTDRQILENILAARVAFKESLINQKTKKPSILGKTVLSTTHGPGIVIDFA